MRLGAVWVRSGKTCAGVYQGSLLLSTPGQPHGPGSQAVRWCLIMYLDRVNTDGLAKGRPTQVAFSLGRSRQRPISGRAAGGVTRIVKVCRTLQRHGVRCGTLVCSGGSPYCWCEIVKEHNRFGCAFIVAKSDMFFWKAICTFGG